jgi:hypothetical protein
MYYRLKKGWRVPQEEALAHAQRAHKILFSEEGVDGAGPITYDKMLEYIEKYADQKLIATQRLDHLTISLLNGITFTILYPLAGLKPAKFIHVERYQFDHKSPAKWEMRENGSICNNARILAEYSVEDYPTEESALVEARAYVDHHREQGFDVRLTTWTPELQRYLQIYPASSEHALLLKLAHCTENGQENGLLRAWLKLPAVCSGCGADRRDRLTRPVRQNEKEGAPDRYYCEPCYHGAQQAVEIFHIPLEG